MSLAEPDIDTRIGARVRDLRVEKGLTLDGLARLADVSRAMLSRIERGKSSATAQLLNKVCGGLGVTLSMLFADQRPSGSPLSRRNDQPTWRDPATHYLRRNVSPAGTGSPVDIVEVEFPADSSVAFDNPRMDGADQHVWILERRTRPPARRRTLPARNRRLPDDAFRPACPVSQHHTAPGALRRYRQPWSRKVMTETVEFVSFKSAPLMPPKAKPCWMRWLTFWWMRWKMVPLSIFLPGFRIRRPKRSGVTNSSGSGAARNVYSWPRMADGWWRPSC